MSKAAAKLKREDAAKRKREERERKREAGLIPVQEWVDPADAAKLRAYAERLRKARVRLHEAQH